MRKLLFLLVSLFPVFICYTQTISIVFSGKEIQYDSLLNAAQLLKSQLELSGYKVIIHNDEKSASTHVIDISTIDATQTKKLKSPGAEGFSLFCNDRKVALTATTALGIRNGIFTYLESLGFRYYFPNSAWYIIPQKPNLFRPLNKISSPSFAHRRIWYGYGTTGSASGDSAYKFWFMANKLGGAMQAVVGESYSDIVYRNKQEFQQHPEWFYPIVQAGVIPSNPKFDLANDSLVNFVIKDVLQRLEKAKQRGTPLKMVSLCPSDGGGTCNSPTCHKLGTITDRVYSLINKAARAANQKYPGTWISGMAYADYSAPPTKRLEPNTFVSVATAFNNTKYTTEELIKGWGIKSGMVGVYDYLGLYVWDFDLPGKGQASRVSHIAANVKKYHQLGARGYDAESTPGSINKGLGHYITARLLWDVNTNYSNLEEEFFIKCFGSGAGLMKQLWKEWENYPYDEVRESDLANWIDVVDRAGSKEKGELFTLRIMHIRQYLHYLHLYNIFKKKKTEADLVNLLTFCFNTTESGSVAANPALWVLGNTSSFSGLRYNDPGAKYRKANPLFNKPDYLEQQVKEDRASLKVKERIPAFKADARLKTNTAPLSPVFNDKQYDKFKRTTVFTGIHYFVFKIAKPGDENYLTINGGLVTGGGSEKPIILSVYPYSKILNEDKKAIITYSYNGKRDTQTMSLNKLPRGDYFMRVEDPAKMFRLNFSPAVYYSIYVTPKYRFNGYSRYMSFYVPEGIKKFRIFKQIVAIVISPSGRVIDKSSKGSEEIDVEVLKGESGMWMINFVNGMFHIEGIPPYLGIDQKKMIVQ